MNVIIRRDCYEKKKAFVPFFRTGLCSLSPIQRAWGVWSGGGGRAGRHERHSLNAQEREAFHRNVADDEAFIHLVTTAAEHKGRDVSLEGVHPDKCLKLYGLKRSEQSLIESLCGVYGETGKIESLFSDDYGVLVLYVNENDEYVDSFVFTRKENLPGARIKTAGFLSAQAA